MQTFSYLQRSSNDEKNFLKYFLFLFLILTYEPLSTIYLFLPPLLGLMLKQAFSNTSLETKVFVFVYIYFYEIDHSLPPFSLFITLFLCIYILHRLHFIISSRRLLQIFGVIIFYSVLFFVLILYGFVIKEQITVEIYLIFLYILFELSLMVAYEK